MEIERRRYYQKAEEKSEFEKKQKKYESIINSVLAKNPENEEDIIGDIKRSNPNLHEYLLGMGILRGNLQREFLKTPKNRHRYFQGAAIMDKVLKSDYRSQKKKPPKLSERIIQTTFQDLTGSEDTHYESDVINTATRQPLKNPISPQNLLEMPKPGEEANANYLLCKNLVVRSNHAYNEFMQENDNLMNLIQYKTTHLDSNIDSEINQEKFPEYVYGALDVYLAYKRRDTSRELRAWYNSELQ